VINNKHRIALRPKDKFEIFLVYSFPDSSISGGVLTMSVCGEKAKSLPTQINTEKEPQFLKMWRPTETPIENSIQGRVKRSRHDMPVQAQKGGRGTAPNHSKPGAGSGWLVNTTSRSLYPRDRDPLLITRRLSGAKDWIGRAEKNSTPRGFDLRTVPSLASRYTYWGTPAKQHVVAFNIEECW